MKTRIAKWPRGPSAEEALAFERARFKQRRRSQWRPGEFTERIIKRISRGKYLSPWDVETKVNAIGRYVSGIGSNFKTGFLRECCSQGMIDGALLFDPYDSRCRDACLMIRARGKRANETTILISLLQLRANRDRNERATLADEVSIHD